MKRKTALITGASAGLGAEFARQLAAQGHDLILIARRRQKLEAVAAELEGTHGITAHILVGDLSEPGCPAALFEQVEALGLAVDVLINNAGSAGPHLISDRDWAANASFIELMITSVAQMCHRFIPGMVERGYGRVVNVASVAGRVPRAAGANYGPAKAYVIALSEDLSLSLEGTGVNVSALCPGFTHTDFHEAGGLSEMKARLPGWMWYDADVVVADGLAAVERGKPVMVSGRLYRWADPFFQSVWIRPLLRRGGRAVGR